MWSIYIFIYNYIFKKNFSKCLFCSYLYWTNCNLPNSTIERSRLDGTDRQVIVHENLYIPLGIAIDIEQNTLYWSDEREGIYFSIESINLNNDSRNTLIYGTHHQPFAIALDNQKIYWSDWTNSVVWSISKDSFLGGENPEKVIKIQDKTPMGLIIPPGNKTLVNETYCALNRAKVCFGNLSTFFPHTYYSVVKHARYIEKNIEYPFVSFLIYKQYKYILYNTTFNILYHLLYYMVVIRTWFM